MATKYYGIKDNWTDDDVANVIEVASEDGSVSSVKVNGVEYGGGGGGGAATVTFTEDSTGLYLDTYFYKTDENNTQVGNAAYNIIPGGTTPVPVSNNDVIIVFDTIAEGVSGSYENVDIGGDTYVKVTGSLTIKATD